MLTLDGNVRRCRVRPFSKADIKRLGPTIPPTEPILAAGVADPTDKQAVLDAGHKGVFTTRTSMDSPVLIELDAVSMEVLQDVVVVHAQPVRLGEVAKRPAG